MIGNLSLKYRIVLRDLQDLPEAGIHELVLRNQKGQSNQVSDDFNVASHVNWTKLVLAKLPKNGCLEEGRHDCHEDEKYD